MPRIRVSARDVLFAFHNRMPGTTHYLDTRTGEVVPVFAYNRTRVLAEIKATPDRYIRLAPESGRQGYEIMKSFVITVDDDDLRKRLEEAVVGENAFRQFRSVIGHAPKEKARWERYQAEKTTAGLREKLTAAGIEMVLVFEG